MAAGQQRFIQRIQLLQVRHHAGQLLAQVLGLDAVGMLEQLADLGVGQARMGVDHRFVELIAGQLAGLGQGHLADHGQPVDQWIQRAETIGQHLRQHRDHPLGEIHRVAAPGRLFVQRRTDLHVVRDIGDRHEQAPAAAAFGLGVHRVVEVAGILAVDGDEGHLAQVDTLFLVLLRHFRLELGRFLLHRGRPDVGDIVAAQGDFDLHPRRHVVAEHLDDLALGLAVDARPLLDAHLDELVVPGLAGLARRDQDFLLDLRVVRDHHADAAFLEVAADHDLVGPLDHLDQLAFAASAPVMAGHPCQGAVAVEHQAHLGGAEEQVVAAIVGDQEAEAIAVPADAAADQVQLVHRRVGATTRIDKLPVALHGAQATTQGLFRLLAGEPELVEQLGASRRSASLG